MTNPAVDRWQVLTGQEFCRVKDLPARCFVRDPHVIVKYHQWLFF